ncbi:branched-chain amino acid ABC transporter permease [Bradyrhizobium lablabi]|uniref:branched-chain amino acid ABC transporter permease n=1 Tax=Bradyrhizobium lablabi TaxID=722472 RepID=UPI001BAA0DCA|nr:branched-chain amino acid ABC transporter permease [Bradyrhizobium lablabi]MBR1122599.1 branched-chain amino acid ABC transporter permease [Bradyrhizobium lablabi]
MPLRPLLFAAAILAFFAAPQLLPEFYLFQICLIAGTALAVLGLVVVTGLAGQISLAQSAFVALGGYGASILAASWGVPLWAGIPVVAVVVAGLGFLLGQMTLRVAGHYLALATLAVTAIVQLALIHWEALTGGAAGMAVPPFEIMGRALTSGRELYYVIVPVTALFILTAQNLIASRFGRALTAIRQSETAAEAMGLDVLRYKAAAFAASAFLGAVAGGLLAPLSTYLDPAQYGITYAIYFLAIAVVGGMTSPTGAVIGSAVFVLLPNYLQAFQSYLGLVFALLLLGFIVLRPNGLSSLPWLRQAGALLHRTTGPKP